MSDDMAARNYDYPAVSSRLERLQHTLNYVSKSESQSADFLYLYIKLLLSTVMAALNIR